MRIIGRHLGWLGTIIVAMLSLGCGATALPQNYPSRNPAGMSFDEARQNQQECVATAARATVERAWTYIGCMVAKGHAVDVQFHVRGETTLFGVTQTRPHDGPTAAIELEGCRKSAYADGRAVGGTRDAVIDKMESTFSACLAPRGYVAERRPPVRPR